MGVRVTSLGAITLVEGEHSPLPRVEPPPPRVFVPATDQQWAQDHPVEPKPWVEEPKASLCELLTLLCESQQETIVL